MISIMMPPLSLAQIRGSAARLRNILGIPEDSYVDIVKIMDNLPDTFGVVVEIVPVQEMGEKHGETYPVAKKIRLREDVYDRACQGYGRDRLTLAHELAHLIHVFLPTAIQSGKLMLLRGSFWRHTVLHVQ